MNSIQTRLYNDFITPQSSEISFNVCVSFFFFFFFLVFYGGRIPKGFRPPDVMM